MCGFKGGATPSALGGLFFRRLRTIVHPVTNSFEIDPMAFLGALALTKMLREVQFFMASRLIFEMQ